MSIAGIEDDPVSDAEEFRTDLDTDRIEDVRHKLFVARTERNYLRTLLKEARYQLAARDRVILEQEDTIRQDSHDGSLGEYVARTGGWELVPAAEEFFRVLFEKVVSTCSAPDYASLPEPGPLEADKEHPERAGCCETNNERGIAAESAHLADNTAARKHPDDVTATWSPEAPRSEGSPDRVVTCGVRPKDGRYWSAPPADGGAGRRVGRFLVTTMRPLVVSAAVQTDPDPVPLQLEVSLGQTELLVRRCRDYETFVQQQTALIGRLQEQLARSAEENQRMQRHLQMVNSLFEQLHQSDVDGETMTEISRQAQEAAGEMVDPASEQTDGVDDLVERVNTPHGRRLVIHVSKTYLRLRDLILEKRALLSEIDKLKGFNVQLEKRLSKQERRLSNVTAELHNTWGLVTKLKIQHAQLHTAESVLRYELREKRKLLSRLRNELEGSRERSSAINQMNSDSEIEIRAIRLELDKRKRELVRQRHVEEDGADGSAYIPPVDLPDLVPATSPTAEEPAAGAAYIPPDDLPELAPPTSPPAEEVEVGEELEGAEAAPVQDKASRLHSLEDQCKQLYTRLVSTTARQVALSSRLAELHSSRGETPSAASSSTDTAYASIDRQQPPSEADTEAEELPADSADSPTPRLAFTEAEELPADSADSSTPRLAFRRAVHHSMDNIHSRSTETLENDDSTMEDVDGDESPTESPESDLPAAVPLVHEVSPLTVPPAQMAVPLAHRSASDSLLVSRVVTLMHPGQVPPESGDVDSRLSPSVRSPSTNETAGSHHSSDGYMARFRETSSSDSEPSTAPEVAEGAALAAQAGEFSEVSRDTSVLLEEVARFLTYSRRFSNDSFGSSQPAGELNLTPVSPGASSVGPPSYLSDQEDAEPAREADESLISTIGCKLISMLPTRMAHLRRERDELASRIAQLERQNERIEMKLSRMRAEREETRRRGRAESTAKRHLEQRVQELELRVQQEQELRLQLTQRDMEAPEPGASSRVPAESPVTSCEQPVIVSPREDTVKRREQVQQAVFEAASPPCVEFVQSSCPDVAAEIQVGPGGVPELSYVQQLERRLAYYQRRHASELRSVYERLDSARAELNIRDSECQAATESLAQLRTYLDGVEFARNLFAHDLRTVLSAYGVLKERLAKAITLYQKERIDHIDFKRCMVNQIRGRTTTIQLPDGGCPQLTPCSDVVRCQLCENEFSCFTVRKQNCHLCGGVFCRKCACVMVRRAKRKVRICVDCFYRLTVRPVSSQDSSAGKTNARPQEALVSSLVSEQMALLPRQVELIGTRVGSFFADPARFSEDVHRLRSVSEPPEGAPDQRLEPEVLVRRFLRRREPVPHYTRVCDLVEATSPVSDTALRWRPLDDLDLDPAGVWDLVESGDSDSDQERQEKLTLSVVTEPHRRGEIARSQSLPAELNVNQLGQRVFGPILAADHLGPDQSNIEVYVDQMHCFLQPVKVTEPTTLHWSYTSRPRPLGFTVWFHPLDPVPDGAWTLPLVTWWRRWRRSRLTVGQLLSPQAARPMLDFRRPREDAASAAGQLNCTEPGYYSLVFDNSASRHFPTLLSYQIWAVPLSQSGEGASSCLSSDPSAVLRGDWCGDGSKQR